MEVVRRVLEAWQQDDFEAFLSGTDPTIEWHTVLERMVEAPRASIEATREYGGSGTSIETELDDFEVEAQDLRDVGDDRVVLLGKLRWRGLKSGIESEAPLGAVITLRDGKKIQSIDYLSHQEALKAVGLKE